MEDRMNQDVFVLNDNRLDYKLMVIDPEVFNRITRTERNERVLLIPRRHFHHDDMFVVV